MKTATVAQAKAHLSELLGEVTHARRSVTITRRGRPVAKLVPVDDIAAPHLGKMKGWLESGDPFFEAMSDIAAARRNSKPRPLSF